MIGSQALESLVQQLGQHIWQRPELKPLRAPIEHVTATAEFHAYTRSAFETFEERVGRHHLPHFFDAAFIGEGPVQEQLAAYIIEQREADLDELLRRYARIIGPDPQPTREAWAGYMAQLRETFAAHPTYGPILAARDSKAMLQAIERFRQELHDHLDLLQGENRLYFEMILDQLGKFLQTPAIKEVVATQLGTHVFLSYSRRNQEPVKRIRERLEGAGHTVWQDTTAIKGGREWVASIQDGIRRAYAVVTVVSTEANASDWVEIEFLESKRREKHIIPIKIDASEIPMMMLNLNVIHAHPDLEAGIDQMLASLHSPQALDARQSVEETQHHPLDRRQLEEEYLNGILLSYSVWKKLYTPMSGVGEMRKQAQQVKKSQVVTTNTAMEQRFRRKLREQLHHEEPLEIERHTYSDILPAIEKMRQLIILGDPGSGKTTTLWRIAADAAEQALADAQQPLPLFLTLSALGKTAPTLNDLIGAQLGDLAPYRAELNLLYLLDGLNELPTENRARYVTEIKTLVATCQEQGRIIAVTCRELDYQGTLNLDIPERVVIEPLDPIRIQQFIRAYIKEPADASTTLFWKLAGDYAAKRWQAFREHFTDLEQPEHVFWLHTALPAGKRWGYSNNHWEHWLQQRHHPRSMLTLARNPYMLYMITQVFTEEGDIPANRGSLFELFVDFLLIDREGLSEETATDLKDRLSNLAYAMQSQGEGTSFEKAATLEHLVEDLSLYQARSANILTEGEPIRFTHQLLQEYFAARKLDEMMKAGKPATDLWPPAKWWEPTGWEETAILLAGLYSDNCTDVLTWLRDANPHLAARCAVESGASTPDATKTTLQQQWLPRLTDHQGEPDPRSRAGVGRGLGLLNLDSRKGVGVKDGLPEIDWVQIPAGEFIYGSDKAKDPRADDDETPQRTLHLESFYISRYPITYAQYQVFIDDPAGYHNDEWWNGLVADADDRELQEQGFKYWNHPRETVNWYQVTAFCRWWSWRLTGTVPAIDKPLSWAVRLPTEFEWEKAARGTDGRIYPYGNEFDPNKGNTDPTGIGMTSAVGVFPQGASPYGVQDMSGNVWEWCLTDYSNPDHLDISNTNRRVLRGGSWYYSGNLARAAVRSYGFPSNRSFDLGGRVVCVRPPSP